MSNSVQTVVSNGSLTLLDLSINYFDRAHIKVSFNAVEQALGTTWSWVGTADKKIQFTPAVAAGVVVQVKRQTPLNAPRHVYSSPGNAPFNKSTVDENFLQSLYASQEAAEGASLEAFAQDVTAAGHKLTDLGDAMLDGDAVSLKVLRDYLPYGPAAASLAARVAAEEAVTAKLNSQGVLKSAYVITGFDASALEDGAWVHFAGRDSVGDGGGGPLRFLKDSLAAADGVTCYAVTGGRLVRDGWTVLGFNGDINVKWAGAKGAPVNDTVAFQRAAAAVVGGRVRVPRGTYRIDNVGIRGVVFEGAGFEETIIEAHAATSGYLLDCTLNTDGVTTNTDGHFGGARNLSIDGRGLGAGGIRTYGGFATLEYMWVRRCNVGYDIGLPIAMTVRSLYATHNVKGFHTYSGPGDLATSLNMIGCWSDSNTLYNYHIEQLIYSTFTGCASQGVSAGGIGWFIDGNTNSSGFGASLNFASCSSEGDLGTPFYIKNQRGFTLTAPKIIQSVNNRDVIVLDNASGQIVGYQSPSVASGFYGLRVTNLTDSLGSVVLTGGEFTMPDAELALCTVLGSQVNGRRRLSLAGNDHGQTESPSGLGVTENNYGGLTSSCGRARLTTFNPTATITGLIGGDDGREIHLFNYSPSNSIVLAHEGAGSTPEYRFVLPGATNLTLSPYSSVVIVYDGTLQRWTVKGG